MKKPITVVLVLLFILSLVSPLFAEVEESEYFVKTLLIMKVYPHQLGYRVLYKKSSLDFGEVFIPHRWRQEPAGDDTAGQEDAALSAGGKLELRYGEGAEFPYLSVYWKNGAFSHVKLYLHKQDLHSSYGKLDPTIDYTDEFNVDEIILD